MGGMPGLPRSCQASQVWPDPQNTTEHRPPAAAFFNIALMAAISSASVPRSPWADSGGLSRQRQAVQQMVSYQRFDGGLLLSELPTLLAPPP